jgi:hypothetical protein
MLRQPLRRHVSLTKISLPLTFQCISRICAGGWGAYLSLLWLTPTAWVFNPPGAFCVRRYIISLSDPICLNGSLQVYYTMPCEHVRLHSILTDVYWTEKYKAVGGEGELYLKLPKSIRFWGGCVANSIGTSFCTKIDLWQLRLSCRQSNAMEVSDWKMDGPIVIFHSANFLDRAEFHLTT